MVVDCSEARNPVPKDILLQGYPKAIALQGQGPPAARELLPVCPTAQYRTQDGKLGAYGSPHARRHAGGYGVCSWLWGSTEWRTM